MFLIKFNLIKYDSDSSLGFTTSSKLFFNLQMHQEEFTDVAKSLQQSYFRRISRTT